MVFFHFDTKKTWYKEIRDKDNVEINASLRVVPVYRKAVGLLGCWAKVGLATCHWLMVNNSGGVSMAKSRGPNQHIERQEVALPKQMHMSVAM